MRQPPLIETERLVLRLPVPADAPAAAAYYYNNRDFLQPWYPTFERDIFTTGHWEQRALDTSAEFKNGRGCRFLILPHDSEEVIGVINFTSIQGFPAHSCTLGYSLAQSWQGHGIMREALSAAIPYVLQEFNLHRIHANYRPENERSGRLLKQLGFVEEGLARDYLLIDGCWCDHVMTAYVNPDWDS